MCGRQACTLAPDGVSRACQYRDATGKTRHPRWKNDNNGTYKPSYNIGPQTSTPVLAMAKQLGLSEEDYGERVLCPMKWGLIPPWSKNNGKGFNTINCRVETINEKVTYKQPLHKGRRCVVLADGFFEWHDKDGKKQPYFIYFKDNVTRDSDPVDGHDTPNSHLLTMAGLYEESSKSMGSSGAEEETTSYSYTVITVPSSKSLSWLHDRMPAVLETDVEVRQWLDSGEIPVSKALALLKPKDCLQWYPVSTVVNNIRNKSIECVQKIDLDCKKEKKSKGMMDFWVTKSPRKTKADSESLAKSSSDVKQEVSCLPENTIQESKEFVHMEAKKIKISKEEPL